MNHQPKSEHPPRHLLHPPVPRTPPWDGFGLKHRSFGESSGVQPRSSLTPHHAQASPCRCPQMGSDPRVPPAQLPAPRERQGRGSLGQGAHMMVQRFLRRAPWKRMVVWTCLQRAQPTLLRSSLKSSRMCQLYLAEHSM